VLRNIRWLSMWLSLVSSVCVYMVCLGIFMFSMCLVPSIIFSLFVNVDN